MSRGVAAVNSSIQSDDDDSLLVSLTSTDLNLHSVTRDCIPTYRAALKQAAEESSQEGRNSFI